MARERDGETKEGSEGGNTEEKTTSQGRQAASRSWKRQGKELPLKPQVRKSALFALSF